MPIATRRRPRGKAVESTDPSTDQITSASPIVDSAHPSSSSSSSSSTTSPALAASTPSVLYLYQPEPGRILATTSPTAMTSNDRLIAIAIPRRRPRDEDAENTDPNTQHSIAASTSSSTAAAAEPPAKKRRKSADTPRTHTLTKEELTGLIERGEFWQQCEAAEGEGDGYKHGRSKDVPEHPIYEDCNEIRRKIKQFLTTARMTQTAWLRLLECNSNSYRRFMLQRGPFGGCHNGVYAGAARFFESLRILERRTKSVMRLKEEAAFGRYGRSTEDQSRGVLTEPGDRLKLDAVGRLHIVSAPRKPAQ